ncbi:MAG: 2-desacetyl-2-hydroxyethyl bacteriochlorophyllide A dehydrogenase [Vicingaceae bacterium]|jgi:2-desacetyl-2-hydroxyethyl bacteriochlorophyllide A dehydrogenase
MKAAIVTIYGKPEVLQLREVEKPSPKEDQILLKIHTSSVTSGDARIRRADPYAIRLIFGFKRPRKSILGVVVAGEVESVGSKVSKFKVGDKVFGTTGMSFGAHAQYQCISEEGTLAVIPENMSYEDAAAIPFGGTAALHFLRKGNVSKGQKVLIFGASGALGTAAIQLAKERGAEVTAVCSGKNAEMVAELGADIVIDYTKEDFTENGEMYDVIFDTIGKSSFAKGMKSLTKKGTMLLASADMGLMIRGGLTSMFGNKKVISGVIKETADDMKFFKKLIEAGKLKAVVDKVYPLEEIARAHTHVDGGHKKGNVIISMNHTV